MAVKIITSDAIEGLGKIDDGSVHCCVTSPLNPEYAEMARIRIEGDAGMFTDVSKAV